MNDTREHNFVNDLTIMAASMMAEKFAGEDTVGLKSGRRVLAGIGFVNMQHPLKTYKKEIPIPIAN